MPSFFEKLAVAALKRYQGVSCDGRERAKFTELKELVTRDRAHREVLSCYDSYELLLENHNENLRIGLHNAATLVSVVGTSVASAAALKNSCGGKEKDRLDCFSNWLATACCIGSAIQCADQVGSIVFRSSHLRSKMKEMDNSPGLLGLCGQGVLKAIPLV